MAKTVKIYENWTQNNGTYFTLQKPCADWAEIVDIVDYEIPAGYEVAEDTCGVKHFYNSNDPSYPLWIIEQNGKPYIVDVFRTIELKKAVTQ